MENNFRNCLGRTRLDACLRISKKGVDLDNFNPDTAIDIWYNEKIRHLTTTTQKYPKNKQEKKQNKPEKVLDVVTITISDLKDIEEEEIK